MIHLCNNTNNQHGADKFTLGAVLQTLSTLSKEKKLDIKSQDCLRANVVRALNHQNCNYPRKSTVSSTNIDALRKSLKQQVKQMKTKPKKSVCRALKHGYHQHEKENFAENESYFISAMLPFNKEGKSYTQEQDLDEDVFLKDGEEELNSSEKDLAMQTSITRNIVYSRHLQNNSADVESFSSGNDDFVDILGEESRTQQRKMRRASSTSSLISNTSVKSHKRSQSQNSNESKDGEKVSVKIEEEKDFVSGLSDPSLKDSMQKILQRRKSTLFLFKSAKGGLKVLNENETFSAITEESSQSSKSVSEFETEKSVCSDFAVSSEFEYETPEILDESIMDNSLFVTPSARKAGRRKGILKNRSNQSARSLNTYDSTKTILKAVKNKTFCSNKVETEETKTIRPLSVNHVGRPCLVPKQTKKRSNTAYSCPETKKEKAKMAEKRKDDVIRDFIIMYAKVKSENAKTEPEDCNREVRMMSETREFVVKSAIGQFLSSPFPPERNATCVNTNEEKYEAKQRTRLLRIKNCMQQLANLA